jgi:hypothetical protein
MNKNVICNFWYSGIFVWYLLIFLDMYFLTTFDDFFQNILVPMLGTLILGLHEKQC